MEKYVKKWVPELRKVPKKFIHKPELVDPKILKLNSDYPAPIVNHDDARSRESCAFKKLELYAMTVFKFFFLSHMGIIISTYFYN